MATEEQKDQQQEAGKVKKRYEKDLEKLTQVLGGQLMFKSNKLLPAEIVEAVKELAKEEKEKLITSFKQRAIAAIQKQRDHLKHVEQLKKDFIKKEEDSMKEFSKTVEELFKDLESIEALEKNYFDILMGYTGKAEEGSKIE